MLQLSSIFADKPILSLRTGSPIGRAVEMIINPDTLKLEGWFCESIFTKGEMIVLSGDVRDIINKGIVVNDHDTMTQPEDLVRLKRPLEIRYQLHGKAVITDRKKKLGKVTDFAIDRDSFVIQNIYVTPPIYKSLQGVPLIIGRNQILELQDKQIIVESPTEKATVPAKATA